MLGDRGNTLSSEVCWGSEETLLVVGLITVSVVTTVFSIFESSVMQQDWCL